MITKKDEYLFSKTTTTLTSFGGIAMLRLNGTELKIEHFPNHETRFKDFVNLIVNGQNLLEFKFEDNGDLIDLKFAKDYLDEYHAWCKLFFWYMPYSRMDRKIEGDLFTLKSIADYINWLGFKKVIVMEPHSSVTLLLLKNCEAVYPVEDWLPYVKEKIGFTENDSVVFPDKGAVARYAKDSDKHVCVIEKKRNPVTCSIEDMYLKDGTVVPGSKCIIVDDLCSRGGTALWAAYILRELGACEVYLAVSHLEEAAFEGDIVKEDSPITKIFASKSIAYIEHPKVEYVDIDVSKYT